MLYKKKRIYNNIFNVRFRSDSESTPSCIIFIRSMCKCLSCNWNSLYGLECKLWDLSVFSKRFPTFSLYNFCQKIDSESRNYKYILISI